MNMKDLRTLGLDKCGSMNYVCMRTAVLNVACINAHCDFNLIARLINNVSFTFILINWVISVISEQS